MDAGLYLTSIKSDTGPLRSSISSFRTPNKDQPHWDLAQQRVTAQAIRAITLCLASLQITNFTGSFGCSKRDMCLHILGQSLSIVLTGLSVLVFRIPCSKSSKSGTRTRVFHSQGAKAGWCGTKGISISGQQDGRNWLLQDHSARIHTAGSCNLSLAQHIFQGSIQLDRFHLSSLGKTTQHTSYTYHFSS